MGKAELGMLGSSTALLSISIELLNFKGEIPSLLLLKIRVKKKGGGDPKDLILTAPKRHVPDQVATKKCGPNFSLFEVPTVTSVGHHGNYQLVGRAVPRACG